MSLWQNLRAPALPQAPALPPRLDAALAGLLGVLGFVLTFSPAGVSLCLAALALLALLAAPSVWRSAPWRDPVAAVGLALLAYILAHTLWTSGFSPLTVRTVNRYHELLMLPVLLALFRLVSRKHTFFIGLACGAVAYAVAHWAVLAVPTLAPQLETRRISAGFALGLCAFVLLEQSRHLARPWMGWLAAAFLAVSVLFAIDGRTGHVVLLLLVACAAWIHSPRRWRWRAMVLLPVVVLGLALGSPAVQKRIGETLAGEATPDGTTLQSSTGIRVELLRNGLTLAREHFATGAGYANYAAVHTRATQARYGADPLRRQYLDSVWVRTSNPHNEYLMQLVGGGIAALALFTAWLLLPMARTGASGNTHALLVGVSLAFAAGCLFNSLLMDFIEGHFYGVLLAWLLAQSSQGAQPRPEHP
jgi:O-antigen ligase